MYFAQAICQPDGTQFVGAIVKEVNGHVEKKSELASHQEK